MRGYRRLTPAEPAEPAQEEMEVSAEPAEPAKEEAHFTAVRERTGCTPPWRQQAQHEPAEPAQEEMEVSAEPAEPAKEEGEVSAEPSSVTTPSRPEPQPPPPSPNDVAALVEIGASVGVATYDGMNAAIDAAVAAAANASSSSAAYSAAYNAAVAAAAAADGGPCPDSAPAAPRCPDTMQIPIAWEQVKYYCDPLTARVKYDSKTSPIALPHPELQFRGYVVDGNNVSALFKSPSAWGKKGTRFPAKPSGGVNKRWFEGLNACTSEEEKALYKKQKGSEYVPKTQRGSEGAAASKSPSAPAASRT